jgi:radical SAM-linked protein
VLIKFKVRGNPRFLSHTEMLRLFQRACVRAGIKVLYSEGFNPHLKLSLPLPKSVGIEVDDDLLCLLMEINAGERESNLCTLVKKRLSMQLPDGFELLKVETAKAGTSIQPCQAVYLLAVRKEFLDEKLKNRIKRLLVSERLNLRRRIGPENSGFKNVDVRTFLKSIEFNDTDIAVECKIRPDGSIRVNEILELLELKYGMLSAPIRRTTVQWQESES